MNTLVGRSMSSPLGFSGINMPPMSQGGSPGSMTQVSVDRDQIYHWIQELSSSDSGVREQALMELRCVHMYVRACTLVYVAPGLCVLTVCTYVCTCLYLSIRSSWAVCTYVCTCLYLSIRSSWAVCIDCVYICMYVLVLEYT